MNWNYENYTKALVPLVLAAGRLLQGWVETGGLERGEVSDVIGLAVVALLVFLAPNVKRHRSKPEGRRTTREDP